MNYDCHHSQTQGTAKTKNVSKGMTEEGGGRAGSAIVMFVWRWRDADWSMPRGPRGFGTWPSHAMAAVWVIGLFISDCVSESDCQQSAFITHLAICDDTISDDSDVSSYRLVYPWLASSEWGIQRGIYWMERYLLLVLGGMRCRPFRH